MHNVFFSVTLYDQWDIIFVRLVVISRPIWGYEKQKVYKEHMEMIFGREGLFILRGSMLAIRETRGEATNGDAEREL